MELKSLDQTWVKPVQKGNDDIRCCCGKLMAKYHPDGIIIRCSRCKRDVLIKFSEIEMDDS